VLRGEMETRGEDYRELEKKVGEFREVIYRKEDEIEELKRKMAFLKKEDRSMEKSRENVADFNEKLRASEQNREKLSEEIENLLQEKATLKDELQKQAKIIETLSETQSRPRITPPTPTNSDLVSILNKEKRELSDLLFQKNTRDRRPTRTKASTPPKYKKTRIHYQQTQRTRRHSHSTPPRFFHFHPRYARSRPPTHPSYHVQS